MVNVNRLLYLPCARMRSRGRVFGLSVRFSRDVRIRKFPVIFFSVFLKLIMAHTVALLQYQNQWEANGSVGLLAC